MDRFEGRMLGLVGAKFLAAEVVLPFVHALHALAFPECEIGGLRPYAHGAPKHADQAVIGIGPAGLVDELSEDLVR